MDAICIDQETISERNLQVGLMREIYSHAIRTIVYLGESDSVSDLILRAEEEAINEDNETPDSTFLAIDLSTINKFLTRTWFSRIWIYQELVVAKEVWVQCGRTRLTWNKLCSRDAIDPLIRLTFDRDQDSTSNVLTTMSKTRQDFQSGMLYGGRSLPTVMDLLSTRRGLGLSDPRDYVYGHLAIAGMDASAQDTNQPTWDVNYEQSITEVFTRAALHIWKNTLQPIELLRHVHGMGYRPKDLPSWVPDWSLRAAVQYPDPHFSGVGSGLPSPVDDQSMLYWPLYSCDVPPIVGFTARHIFPIIRISEYDLPSTMHIQAQEREIYNQ